MAPSLRAKTSLSSNGIPVRPIGDHQPRPKYAESPMLLTNWGLVGNKGV